MRFITYAIASSLVAVTLGIGAGPAHADAVKCRAAIGKNAAAFLQARTNLLQKCNDALFKGKIAGGCPDAATADKIAGAKAKAEAAIARTCGGEDKLCGTVDDDTLASIGWNTTSQCPNLGGGTCANAIGNCDDIGTCLGCVDENGGDQAVALYYGDLVPSDPKTQKALNKCQLAIGKSATALLAAQSKALQKCWDTVNKGTATDPCPPFGAGDGKASAAIAKAAAKSDATICKACGGADRLCGGGDDLTPLAIGFALECPAVTVPGTSTQACAHAVTTLDELRECVDCVTAFDADCASLAAATGFPSAPTYPDECSTAPADATPTATPTSGATATETPTATPTTTPTATPTLTATGTLTATPTATLTATPTLTATGTPTVTPTPLPHFAYSSVAVACYDFESGALGTDSCGVNTLTNNGVTAGATGAEWHSSAGTFVRASSQYLTGTSIDAPELDISGDTVSVTYMCWNRPTSVAGNQWHALMAKGTDLNRSVYFANYGDDGTYGVEIHDFNGTGNTVAKSAAPAVAGQDYHVAFTYDGAQICLYVNGVNAMSGGTCLPYSGGIADTPDAFFVGATKDDVGVTKDVFDGTIDECAVFAMALADKDVCDICRFGLDGHHVDRGAACNNCVGN